MEKSRMSEVNHISSASLPLGQNYKGLREMGMDFIQTYSGVQWTNLNPSDPGVTFLDELCYALTELGYCTGFSIEDLLTNKEGDLCINQQFYLPENILTSSSITLNDFRKYIIDQVPEVENVTLQRNTVNGKETYSALLKISATILASKDQDQICQDVMYSLDRTRNLGQNIKLPAVLERKKFQISGSLSLNYLNDFLPFLSELIQATEQVIFPTVFPVPYAQIQDWENETSQLFNGPFLQRGAISDKALGAKKDSLSSFEMVNVLKSLSQVKGVNQLGFNLPENHLATLVSVDMAQLIEVDWVNSILSGGLMIYANGQLLAVTSDMIDLHLQVNQNESASYSEEFDSLPKVKGTFRDVNSYYSIQETLPDVYGVGANALKESDSALKKGQSRQLKGYLTLFDQLLSNQFAQLANLGTLFSFENATIAAPSDYESYLSEQSKLEKERTEYPAAFKVYAPTYFYQSLYAVSDIRPLLKGSHAFDYTNKFSSPKQVANEGWKQYKNDPYNPYMKGLMDLMTDEQGNLDRRNAMLNHLLSRHGESPVIIDQIIEGSSYAGTRLMDQVIFKSLFLQNYGTLSYNRQRSYSVFFAEVLTEDYRTLEIDIDAYTEGSENNDFILDAKAIDQMEKVKTEDFENFSSVELKFSLLLGIKPLYKEFIVNYYGSAEESLNLSQLNWLLQEKKGCVFIESCRLDTGEDMDLEDLIFIFPSYATIDIIPSFKSRLELCLLETLPVNLTYQLVFANAADLSTLLLDYTPWFNMQRLHTEPQEDPLEPVKIIPMNQVDFRAASISLYNSINKVVNE